MRLLRTVLAMYVLGISAPAVSADENMRTVAVDGGAVNLAVPSNWNEIPTDVLEFYSLRSAELSGGRNAEFYQHGYRPGDPEKDFALPQILIQIRESGRLKYGEFLHLPSMKSQIEENDWRIDERKGPMVEEITFRGASFDRASHTLRIRNAIDLKIEGRVIVDSVSFLTEKGLFTVHCYTSLPQFTKMAPVFEDIIASVQFDETIRYRPRLSDRWPPRPATLAYSAAGFITLVLIVVHFVRRGRRQ